MFSRPVLRSDNIQAILPAPVAERLAATVNQIEQIKRGGGFDRNFTGFDDDAPDDCVRIEEF
jgi:hypothetical protein